MRSGVPAKSYPEQGVIVAQRGKATRSDIWHEKGHIALGHRNKLPRNPLNHIKDELAANYYAYKNTGSPKNILMQLRRLYNDLAYREYRVRPARKIMILIGQGLKSIPNLPPGWANDYRKLVMEYKQGHRDKSIGEYTATSCKSSKHKQVYSTNGYLVDYHIIKLVDILNSIPKVETTESCQGGNGDPAFVCFNYKGTSSELLHFVQHIAEYLHSQHQQSTGLITPAYELDMSLKWCGDKTSPFIELCMPSETIDYVASIFSHVETGWNYDI